MMDNYDERADDNASRIGSEIDDLSRGHWKQVLITRDYASFWGHAKNIAQLFKNLKPLRKEDREELWARFSSVCDETKEGQDRKFFDRSCTSERLRNEILHEVHSAQVQDLFGFDPPNIEEMKRLSGVLNSARDMLRENKEEMLGEHRQECFREIQDVQRSHDAWWHDLKEHSSSKKEEFRARVQSNIEKNQEKLAKAKNALEACRNSADKLRDQISSAWNDDWASKASGWLSELEEKISDIEESIERIEGWIEEDEEKLR